MHFKYPVHLYSPPLTITGLNIIFVCGWFPTFRKHEQTITSTEIEFVIWNSQQTKEQDQMASPVNSTKYLIPILLKLFQKLQRKENIWTHFMRPPSPWYQNERYHKKIKLQANITTECKCKTPQQMLANWIQQHL